MSPPPPLKLFSDLPRPLQTGRSKTNAPLHQHPLHEGRGEDTTMRQNQLQFLLIQYARQEFDQPEQ